jgi:hypothetical protein
MVAAHRMALFPEHSQVLFVGDDIWVVLAILYARRSAAIERLHAHTADRGLAFPCL